MGFGLNMEATGNGDIIPTVKYDARAGRFFRVDRADGMNTPVDITNKFKAVLDFENIEVGYMRFAAGVAPDFALVPNGQPLPAKPSADHKQGIRLLMKLGKECGADVRELATTAKTALRGLSNVHDAYEASREKEAGQLPIVALKETRPVKSEGGGNSSTNYEPVFEIVGWANRPTDLIHKPRASTAPNLPDVRANDVPRAAAPPSTGSTKVEPPATKGTASAAADAEDDFG